MDPAAPLLMLGVSYEMHRGFMVPVRETEHRKDRRFRQCNASMESVVSVCRNRRVVVEAGGNWGVWPARLSSRFETVYTFEPDPECFAALTVNTIAYPNVIRLQAGLGDKPVQIDLEREDNKTGSQHVCGSGPLPLLRLDDFNLEICDLIWLDIEGYEFNALKGSEQTIARCNPVIAFEDKGLDVRYQTGNGGTQAWLEERGYKTIKRVGNDTVMRPVC